MDLDRPWKDYTYVAFDTETSGAWPVGCDIVEFGAVKWQGGVEIDRLQLLIKPREPMSDFIIGIHGITNEMVANSPSMSEVIGQIGDFMREGVAMAHHAPFDLGFVAADLEAHQLPFPNQPVLCTSLLARKLINGVKNHKLQTLVSHFGIDGGAAHRALDDARACMQVGFRCFEAAGANVTLRKLMEIQEKRLQWADYSLAGGSPVFRAVLDATRTGQDVEFLYDRATASRRARPMGLVRNPDGDFMQAVCGRDGTAKRFYLDKMKDAVTVPRTS